MCYMSAPERPIHAAAAPRVGVRELRQNLSVYLERVIAGERLQVTDRGRPVALLIPLAGGGSLAERLVAEGRALPPSARPGGTRTAVGRMRAGFGARVQQALRELREDRR